MPPTPRGTVSCLFTDIEGSTRLLKALGERYAEVLQWHRALLRGAFAEHGGYEVDTQGDAFFVAFERATAAVAAAASAQRALAAEAWPGGEPLRVRMGIHTGEAVAEEEGYVGLDVHRGARICGAAHGGQVLLSATARELVEGALPADLSLRDLGDHALKDLSGRQRLFQLVLAGLPSDFPPPRAMDARRTNLPAQATSFVGRRREVEQVSALVLDRSVRVLTLMGPGGAGKTRLALQAAAGCLDDVQGGVFVAFLAALRDVDLVLPAIAHAFGLVLRPDREPVETIAEAIGDEPMLIVVDNIEHLLDAVPLLGALVEAAPGLTLLVTSRERLRLAGEHCYVVPPLGLPTDGGASPAAILASDAVSLLVERACAVDAGFRVEAEDLIDVAEVCRRLDGLPLALELAAARLPMLGPAALRRRLDRRLDMLKGGSRDVDHRQRALRATIDWSYDLLEHEERIVLARLGVFVGSFGLEAAERVAGDDVLEVVGSLVDKSLLRAARDGEGEPTFRMLETIREYALERLGEGEEARAAARRHAEHALALAETAAPALEGADQPRWLDRLESAYPDVRAAIVWSIEHDVGLALRIASALHLFWSVRGYLADGRTLLQEALSRASDADPLLRADALVASAYLGFFLGDSGGALVEAEQAVGLIGAGEDRHRDVRCARSGSQPKATTWRLPVRSTFAPARSRAAPGTTSTSRSCATTSATSSSSWEISTRRTGTSNKAWRSGGERASCAAWPSRCSPSATSRCNAPSCRWPLPGCTRACEWRRASTSRS
jgi:predicted ATPase/class 3 adenylate cyclase